MIPVSRPTTRRGEVWLLAAILFAVTVLLYSPARHHPFVNYDDDTYVAKNTHIQGGVTWATVTWAFTSYDAANWHPLTWLSHAADYQLFGAGPAGPHEVNVVLHALNALLLFLLLWRATGALGRSYFVAALFALHPVNVESVVWIAERKNVLSMLFFLLALAAYDRYARKPGWGRYLVVALMFALGSMAKPQIITLPFVLLLWDYWPLERLRLSDEGGDTKGLPQRSLAALVLEKVPLLLMAGASALVTMQAQKLGGINRALTLPLRLENVIVSYVRYLGLALWPTGLAPIYPHPGASLRAWQVLGAFVLLALITALVWIGRRHRYLPVGWLWFLGTLVPMIGIVQVGRQAMADRYAYVPFIGLFVITAWGLAEVAGKLRIPLPAQRLAGLVVLAVLALLTYRQIGYWSDNVTLWTHAVAVTRNNYVAEDSLGEALLATGEQEEANRHFARASEIDPSYAPSRMYLALYDQKLGALSEAIAQYQAVLRITNDGAQQNAAIRSQAFGDLGRAYLELKQDPAARQALESAVTLNAANSAAWLDLGVIAERDGDHARAVQALTKAVEQQPSDISYVLLARALSSGGQAEEAREALRQASQLSSNLAAAEKTADHLLGK